MEVRRQRNRERLSAVVTTTSLVGAGASSVTTMNERGFGSVAVGASSVIKCSPPRDASEMTPNIAGAIAAGVMCDTAEGLSI